ncbi:MAG: hypothetical protein H0U59_14205, partial [Gemmatimonadaceae bacterium]|nr:hypothetical protein [Gemmatimonadaceae bacterium]
MKEEPKSMDTEALWQLAEAALATEFLLCLTDTTTNVFRICDAKKMEVTLCENEDKVRRAIGIKARETTGKAVSQEVIDAALNAWRIYGKEVGGWPSSFSSREADPGRHNWTFNRFAPEVRDGDYPAWQQFLARLSDPTAFMRFVWSIFQEDSASRQYLWLWGEPRTGKSEVLKLLYSTLGKAAFALDDVQTATKNKHLTSALIHKRLLIYADCRRADFASHALVRNLTTGDPVTVEFKGKDLFSLPIRLKLAVASNYKPEAHDKADASRLLLIRVGGGGRTNDPSWPGELLCQL